jgi:hypothetical protein
MPKRESMCKQLAVLFSLLFVSASIIFEQERSALPALAQQSAAEKPAASVRAEVLALGTYHMSNPGQGIFNMHADDLLAPKRQAEIAQLIEVLKRFRPTKIAVEFEVGDDRVNKSYADYLAGRYELSRNEVEQIGFRLAKELGHKTIYPVNVEGEFPFPRVVDDAKAHGRSKELDEMMAETGNAVKAQDAYLSPHAILETLLYMNSDDKVAEDVGSYYRLAHFGEPNDWAGADLISDWFRRNMRIYGNVVRLIESPNERVLVIFGAGHLGWLQHEIASDPSLRFRKLAEFAK